MGTSMRRLGFICSPTVSLRTDFQQSQYSSGVFLIPASPSSSSSQSTKVSDTLVDSNDVSPSNLIRSSMHGFFYGILLSLRSSIVREGNSKYSRAQNASNLLAEKLSNIHIVRSFTLLKDSSERCLVGSSFIQNTAANLRRGKCTPQQKRPLPNKHLFAARGYPGDLNRSCPVPCAER